MSSLDDLLEYDDNPAPRRRGTARVSWLTGAVIGSVILTVVLYFGLRFAVRIDVPVVLLFVFVFACLVLRRILSSIQVAPPVPTSVPGHDGTQFDWDTPDGMYVASGRWATRLGASSREADRFTAIVTPPLTELVDERLRLRHGVDRRLEPERARQMIGEPLWTFLHGELRDNPSPHEMAAIVAAIESL